MTIEAIIASFIGADILVYCLSQSVLLMQERKHLAFQLKDTKTVVSKLERIFGVIIHLLFVILYLVIFDVRLSLPSCILPQSGIMNVNMLCMQNAASAISQHFILPLSEYTQL